MRSSAGGRSVGGGDVVGMLNAPMWSGHWKRLCNV